MKKFFPNWRIPFVNSSYKCNREREKVTEREGGREGEREGGRERGKERGRDILCSPCSSFSWQPAAQQLVSSPAPAVPPLYCGHYDGAERERERERDRERRENDHTLS